MIKIQKLSNIALYKYGHQNITILSSSTHIPVTPKLDFGFVFAFFFCRK